MIRIVFIVIFFCQIQLSVASTNPGYIVLFNSNPSEKTLLEIQSLPFVKSIEKLFPHDPDHPYFSRIALLHLSPNHKNSINKFKSLDKIELVTPDIELPVTFSTINPVEGVKYPISDPFFRYQWYLKNIGQTLNRDINDINFYTETCKKTDSKTCENPEDVGISFGPDLNDWWKQREKLEALSKRDVVVAVVDGGVDVNHPDLKGSILKNKKECTRDGNIPTKPDPKKYGKDYPGDCMGWNFVTKNNQRKNKVFDNEGHGTHLAGIIAAQTNNGEGMAGISNKIKILPIKVFEPKPSSSKEKSEPKVLLTSRFIQAMYYAIHRNVDVINLSFGWPSVLETETLRKAFAEVIKKGIIVVAAAGNSAHDTQILPCAYNGVICVGATSITGAIAKFSNYGGHVDLTAPGVEILSTYPEHSRSPRFFKTQRNYNSLSGTSQSTAIVSGMAATLISIYPDISPDELQARLIVSANRLVNKNRPILDGTPRIWHAVTAKEQTVVRPDFKGLNTLVFFMKDDHLVETSPLNIKIKSLWKKTKNIRVKLKSNTPNYTFAQKEFNFSHPEALETFPVSVDIRKIGRESHFSFELSVWANDVFQGNFIHRINISRNIEKDAGLISLPFIFPVGWEAREDIKNITPITISTHSENIHTKPEYMFLSPLREDRKYLELHVFRSMDHGIKKAGIIEVSGASNLIRTIRIDLNYDSELDYLIISSYETKVKDQKKPKVIVQYSFVKHDFSPLLDQQTYQLPFGMEYPGEISSFYKKELKNGKQVAFPVFYANGSLVESDKDSSIFSTENPESPQMRVYYADFHPTKHGWMNFYAFENFLFKQHIDKKLNLDFHKNGTILQILPQSNKHFYTGTTELLFKVSNGDCYVLSVSYYDLLNRKAENIKAVSPDLCSYASFGRPVFEFTDRSFESGVPLAMYQIQGPALAFASIWDSNYNLRPGSALLRIFEDMQIRSVNSSLVSFASKESTYTFFEETDGLVLVAASGSREPVYSRFSLVKSSLLPGIFFHSTITPSFFGGKGRPLRPALIVNYSPITKKHLFLLTIDRNKKLYLPTKFNLHIPKSCSALVTAAWEKSMAFVFYCAYGREKILKILPIR